MKESPEETLKSEERMRNLQAYREALKIISDVSIGTITPPVSSSTKNDWKSSDNENPK